MSHKLGSSELSEFSSFATLHRRERSRLTSLMTRVSFADGDVLCEEGQSGREAFLLIEGEVAVSRGDDFVAMLGAGDVVGELALLGDGRRTASVTAIGDVEAYVMSAAEFASVMTVPQVRAQVERVAHQRTAGSLVAA